MYILLPLLEGFLFTSKFSSKLHLLHWHKVSAHFPYSSLGWVLSVCSNLQKQGRVLSKWE